MAANKRIVLGYFTGCRWWSIYTSREQRHASPGTKNIYKCINDIAFFSLRAREPLVEEKSYFVLGRLIAVILWPVFEKSSPQEAFCIFDFLRA